MSGLKGGHRLSKFDRKNWEEKGTRKAYFFTTRSDSLKRKPLMVNACVYCTLDVTGCGSAVPLLILPHLTYTLSGCHSIGKHMHTSFGPNESKSCSYLEELSSLYPPRVYVSSSSSKKSTDSLIRHLSTK